MKSKTRIVFATNNKNKLKELREIFSKALGGIDFELLSLADLNMEPDVEENGKSYEENAMIKARAVHSLVKDVLVIADDSGIEIDGIPGELGIHSARFMGYDVSYDKKNNAILDRLRGLTGEKRAARFVCALGVIFPDGEELSLRSVWEGRIADDIKGENGFGYDPIFYLEEHGCTSAQLPKDLKNELSHRAGAVRQLIKNKKFEGYII